VSSADRGVTSVEAPAPPALAAELFGPRLAGAEAYARLLASEGVLRGLLGPREVPRLWDRHLLNCAVLADELPAAASVVDVGSGAGLPGLVLALRRTDLRVTLVEPMLRRVSFLEEAVDRLGLSGSVRVVRGRAEDRDVQRTVGRGDWVVARAVAPLDRLVKWCLPLLVPGGRLLALKGARAADEVTESQAALRAAGAGEIEVRQLGADVLAEPTWLVVVERAGGRGSPRREKRRR
jgi:16S rRNA (guanine527-N7)-methyltransferase